MFFGLNTDIKDRWLRMRKNRMENLLLVETLLLIRQIVKSVRLCWVVLVPYLRKSVRDRECERLSGEDRDSRG